MNKVVLVINNSAWYEKRVYRTWLPAVPIITALLKDVCNFSIIDANVNNYGFEETLSAIKNSEADIIMISALSVDYQKQYHKIAELAKEALPNCSTLIGGVYPTILPEQVLKDKNIDFILSGPAEEKLPNIILDILKKDLDSLSRTEGIGINYSDSFFYNPNHKYLHQIQTIIEPDYSLLDLEKYFEMQKEYSAKNYTTECAEKRTVNIISSYGCKYNCFFCANKSLSGCHIVYRPICHVLNEIDFFVKNFQVKQISFVDDNIVADKERAKKLFSELISRNYDLEIQIGNLSAWDLDDEILCLLKRAGCTRVGISVESGSQRVLTQIMRKPLDLKIIPGIVEKFRELDIMLIADFLIGLPGETWEEIRNSMEFAYNMNADLCNINIAVPYPGTDLYDYMKKNNMLPQSFDFDDTFYVNGLVSTDEFIPAELKMLQAMEWERINMSTSKRKNRAMKVLRINEEELNEYCKKMRIGAIRFAKNHT